MIQTKGYAAFSATTDLSSFDFTRRDVGAHDVLIEILYCGVCHSDLHAARNEWNSAIYPIVPGHEIVGKITAIGNLVTNFKFVTF